nr:DUF4011 domain-containing protein [Paracoccaceae bacterium]
MTPANPHASPSGAQGSLLPGGLAYQDFHDLLKEFAAYEAIGTDDALSALLPLMRQVADLHEINRVAPLDGVEDLRVDRGRLWFGNDRAREPRRMTYEISRMQGMAGMLDIGAAPPRFDDEAKELIHVSSERPTKPGFLLGYRCWEHAVGHHDPLTDIFSLGLIGASLATGLDLTEPDQLQAFVTARRRLTQLNRRLHPTAADLLMRMTELDRRRRAQDLRRMIHGFETHRQSHRSHHGGGFGAEPQNRDAKILTELRGRLYDLSRRNKLIYHKPSATELNLTEASAPIVLHVGAIRPEQLFTWTGDLPRRLLSREPLELSEFIRFEEMVYAPAALDKLRTQARKDRTEFGFSQLRLVICFLRWRNLKEAPDEPISSPLLLLPVELKKRRGVRDSYDLRAASQDAEVNPTLRRYLKLLYGVELPPSVDLEQEGEIDRLYQLLRDQIAETEPSVRLEKIDKPPVREIYVRARRRVDLYKKRSKPAGPGVKRYGELAYSYAPTNFRPLGEQLYHTFIAPDLLLELNDQKQRPSVVAATATGAAKPKTAATAAAEKKADTKPQVEDAILSASETQWAFDLCSVTLANFNYRKMSLVRDFDALLEGDVAAPANPARPEEDTPLFAHAATGSAEPQIIGKAAFHALFHDGPKPIAAPPSAPPLEERYPVMPSDPTQDVAIARARAGESYVIQGPPGTGKSQTIANLVADFLGRGKRVLFVCEKRAALDVVHHRLEALNLHRLCALVHDSQEDKRGFVQDIKGLYENWIGAAANPKLDRSRQEAAASAARGLGPLTEVDAGMTSDAGGALVHQVVEQAAAAQELADAARARLGETPLGALPSLADWREGRPAALAVETALKRLGADPVLARHPARYVSADAAADPALFARLTEALNALGPQLDALNAAAELLARRRARGEDGAAAE